MTDNLKKRSQGALAARLATVLAGGVALTLSVGVGAALALTSISAGEYDAIEVGIDDGQLVVQAHEHGEEGEIDPATVQFETSVVDTVNGGFIIAEDEEEGPLSLGIAAEAELWDYFADLDIDTPELTISISGFDGPGNLTVWEGSAETITAPIFNIANEIDSTTITLQDPEGTEDGESFHQHYNWNFSAAGTYTFNVVVSDDSDNADSSESVQYTFVVG
jgi:surface-anchored protein